MKRKFSIILLMLCLLLVGCSQMVGKGESENQVSDQARIVIDAMMICPNEELFSEEMLTNVGEGVQLSDEEKAKISETHEQAVANWENHIGKYFADGYLTKFLNNGPAYDFFVEAYLSGKEIKIDNMVLIEKTDFFETVEVVYHGEKEEKVRVKFEYDNSGLIRHVTIVD